jgi:membrane-bound lytic murein transglycosylase D
LRIPDVQSSRIALVALATILLAAEAAAASPGTPAAAPQIAPDPFPEFEEVRPNVEFWKKVYATWGRGQVAVHDLEYPGVIYEVVELPGPSEERYTEQQIDFVEDLVESWQDRLRAIQRKVADGLPLDEPEKRIVLEIVAHAGSARLEDAHERVRTQRGMRERFHRGIEISYRYMEPIRRAFVEAGLPTDLAYLPHVESSFQARARSSAGAVGIWQFTRGTGRRYMTINSALDERLDPIVAAHGAAAYLREAFDKLGDWPIALTSYNHGVGGMSKAVQQFGPDYPRIFREYRGRTFGFASRNFYAEFLAARAIALDPDHYFPAGFAPEPSFDLDRVLLPIRTTPARVARAHGLDVDELAALNPAWSSRAVRSGLALPRGSSVWLPAGMLALQATRGFEPVYTAAGDRQTYSVQPGDTLSEIARAHTISVTRLRELNGMGASESLIRVGQRLRVGEPAPDAPDGGVHVVSAGENLGSIARRYGISVAVLRSLNGMAADAHLIRVGQRLVVGGAAAAAGSQATHVVRRGDSLIRIASHYGVRLHELLRYNRLTETSIIHPGQRILIP